MSRQFPLPSTTSHARKISQQVTFKQQTKSHTSRPVSNKSQKEKPSSDSVSVGQDDFMSFNQNDDQQIDKSFNNPLQPQITQKSKQGEVVFNDFQFSLKQKYQSKPKGQISNNSKDSFDFERFRSVDLQNSNNLQITSKAEQFNFDQFTQVKNDSKQLQGSFVSNAQGKNFNTDFEGLKKIQAAQKKQHNESEDSKKYKQSRNKALQNPNDDFNFQQFGSVKGDENQFQNSFVSQVSKNSGKISNKQINIFKPPQASNIQQKRLPAEPTLNANANQKQANNLKQSFNFDQFGSVKNDQSQLGKSFASQAQVSKGKQTKQFNFDQFNSVSQSRMEHSQVSHNSHEYQKNNQQNKKVFDQFNFNEFNSSFHEEGKQQIQEKLRFSNKSEPMKPMEKNNIDQAKQSLNFDAFQQAINNSKQFQKSFNSQLSGKNQTMQINKIQSLKEQAKLSQKPKDSTENVYPKVKVNLQNEFGSQQIKLKQSFNFDEFNQASQTNKSYLSQTSFQAQNYDFDKFDQKQKSEIRLSQLTQTKLQIVSNGKQVYIKQSKVQIKQTVKRQSQKSSNQSNHSFNLDQFASVRNNQRQQSFEQSFSSQLQQKKLQNFKFDQFNQVSQSRMEQSYVSKRSQKSEQRQFDRKSQILKGSLNFDQFGSVKNDSNFQKSITSENLKNSSESFNFEQFKVVGSKKMQLSFISNKDSPTPNQKQSKSINSEQQDKQKQINNYFAQQIEHKQTQKYRQSLKLDENKLGNQSLRHSQRSFSKKNRKSYQYRIQGGFQETNQEINFKNLVRLRDSSRSNVDTFGQLTKKQSIIRKDGQKLRLSDSNLKQTEWKTQQEQQFRSSLTPNTFQNAVRQLKNKQLNSQIEQKKPSKIQEFDFAQFESAKSDRDRKSFESSFASQIQPNQVQTRQEHIVIRNEQNSVENPFAFAKERESLNFDQFNSVHNDSKQFQKSFTSQLQKQQKGDGNFNFSQFKSVSKSRMEDSQLSVPSNFLQKIIEKSSQVHQFEVAKQSINFEQFGEVKNGSEKSFTSELSNQDNIKKEDLGFSKFEQAQKKTKQIMGKQTLQIQAQNEKQPTPPKALMKDQIIFQPQVSKNEDKLENPFEGMKASFNFDQFNPKDSNSKFFEKSFASQFSQKKEQEFNFDQFNSVSNSQARQSTISNYSNVLTRQIPNQVKQSLNFQQFIEKNDNSNPFEKQFALRASLGNSQFNFDQFNSVSQSQMRQSNVSGISKSKEASKKSEKNSNKQIENPKFQNPFDKIRESLNLNFDQFGSVKNDSEIEKSFTSQISQRNRANQLNFDEFKPVDKSQLRDSNLSQKSQKQNAPNLFNKEGRQSLNFEQFGSVKDHSKDFDRSFASETGKQKGQQQFNFDQFKSVVQSQIRESQISNKSKLSLKSENKQQIDNPFNNPKGSFNFDEFRSVVQSEISQKSKQSISQKSKSNYKVQQQKQSLGFDDFASVNKSKSQLSQHSFTEKNQQIFAGQIKSNVQRISQPFNFDDFASKNSSSSKVSKQSFDVFEKFQENQSKPNADTIKKLQGSNKSKKIDANTINIDDFASQHSSSKVSKQSLGFDNFPAAEGSKIIRNSINSLAQNQKNDEFKFDDFKSHHNSSKSGLSKKSFDMFDNFDEIKKSNPNANRSNKSVKQQKLQISQKAPFGLVEPKNTSNAQPGIQMFQSVNSKHSNVSSSKNNQSFQAVSGKSQKHSYHQSNENILAGIITVEHIKSEQKIKEQLQQQFKQFEKQSKSSTWKKSLVSNSSDQDQSRKSESNPQRLKYQEQIRQKAPQSLKKLNQLYGKLCNQSEGLNQVTKQSHNYAKIQKQRLSLFKNQLNGIRSQILNAAEVQSQSNDSSFMSDADIRSVVKKLQTYKQSQNNSILALMQKINRIQQMISLLLKKIQQKREKKKADPFYKVNSPLQVAKCFKKDNNSKILLAKAEEPKKTTNELLNQFEKFYINEKFKGQSGYKKLFAPKRIIKNKASSVEISLDYSFENTQSRKVLRIAISVQNNSNSILRQVRVSSVQQGNIVSVKPSRVFMRELKPKEKMNQMIYVGGFNPEIYFVPVQISYVTDQGDNRYMKFPISLDIMKFIQFQRRKTTFQDVQFKSALWVSLSHKTQLQFIKQGDDRVLRLNVVNEPQRVEIHQRATERGYELQIKSSGSNSPICQKLAEYFRFMYA